MTWVKSKWLLLKSNHLLWWNVALLALCVACILMFPAPNASDFRVRSLGMLLQLIGVLTVWFDLSKTAHDFGEDGVFRRNLRWLKAVVLGGQGNTGVGGVSMSAMTGRARAKTRTPLNTASPIPDRLIALEKFVFEVDADLDAAHREIDTRAAELESKLLSESAERQRAVQEVKSSLKSAAAGNYPLLLFGVWWLAAGVFIATLAPEIAKVVAGRWSEVWVSM